MPRGDRTGPQGMGPRTGRGLGYCSGYDTPGYMNPGFGGGFGRGFGRGGGFGGGFGGGGRGRRNRFYATGVPGWAWNWNAGPAAPQAPDREQELAALREEAGYLKNGLAEVTKRIEELESAGDEKKK